jgi:hypothetical protein
MPTKFADIEKKAKDILEKDLAQGFKLKVKHASPVGAAFTSESSADLAGAAVGGKIVVEKFKVNQLPGLTVDKVQISQGKAKDNSSTVEILKEWSYLSGVDGVKLLGKCKLANAAVSRVPGLSDFAVGAEYSDKTVLGTVLVNPGKMTADITFSTAPMADLTVGADVKELNLGASSLKTLTTKASYTSGPIFAAFSLTPQVDPGFAVRPISEATQSLFASYDASSDMAVGLNFERSFSAKTVFSKLNASVQYVYSKETTVRAAVNHEFPVQPKKDEAVNPSSQRTAFSAGIAHKLAKGATAIINVKYIDSPKFGLQLNFDA